MRVPSFLTAPTCLGFSTALDNGEYYWSLTPQVPGAVLRVSWLLSCPPQPCSPGTNHCCTILQMRKLRLRVGTCPRSSSWTVADGDSGFGDTEGCPHPAPCAAHRDPRPGQCCPEGRKPLGSELPSLPQPGDLRPARILRNSSLFIWSLLSLLSFSMSTVRDTRENDPV